MIHNSVGDNWGGVPVLYSHEPEILGVTGGIRKALPLLGDAPFLVLNSDVFFDIDIQALYSTHLNSCAALTIAVKTDLPDSPLNLISFDKSHRVRQVCNSPVCTYGPLYSGISVGAYVYSPDIVKSYVPENRFYRLSSDFIPSLFSDDKPIIAHPFEGYWTDIGEVSTYLDFIRDIFDGRVNRILSRHYVAPDTVIHPSASIIPPCHIAAGCVVHNNARVGSNVVLQRNVLIEKHAAVENSLCLSSTTVSAFDSIKNSIVV